MSPAPAATVESLYTSSSPVGAVDGDTGSVNLGVRFTPTVGGTVSAVTFYRGTTANTAGTVDLWDATTMAKVASGKSSSTTTTGWIRVPLTTAAKVTAGHTYVASFLVPKGRYNAIGQGFATSRTVGHLAVAANGGVYAYASGETYPIQTWNSSEYLVSPVFTPSSTATSTPTPTPTATPTPTPMATPTSSATATSSATPTPTSSTSATPAGGTSLRAVDGGTGYYGTFQHGLPTSPSFFPVAVWSATVNSTADVTNDQATGLNTYVGLYGNAGPTTVTATGSYVISGNSGGNTATGANGSILADEADMWAGPGWGGWTGKEGFVSGVCTSGASDCGYTVMQSKKSAVPSGTMAYANYGKGVMFWDSDSEAAQFIPFSDITSADVYWFTDPDVCSQYQGGALLAGSARALTTNECRRAANYGYQVDRLRKLNGGKKPVWSFVEVGTPGSNGVTIKPAEVRAAVWHSIIAGARGIQYFNHSFSGSCQTTDVLDDPCYSATKQVVMQVNKEIATLAPVLNSPFADGAISSTNGSVRAMAKAYAGDLYVFAGSTKGSAEGSHQVSLTLNPCVKATSASILDGGSGTTAISGGTITQAFSDGNGVTIYKIAGGARDCGLA